MSHSTLAFILDILFVSKWRGIVRGRRAALERRFPKYFAKSKTSKWHPVAKL